MPSQKPKKCPQRIRFGKNLIKLRVATDLTQEAFAEKVGVSPRYLQSLEAGEYWPSLPKLCALKSVLKCDWKDLLKDVEQARLK